MKARRSWWGLGALLLALGAVPAQGQDVTGTVSGTVVDETDQVLPGATVTLRNEQTRSVRSVVTDEAGEFRFASVYPGSYTVRVELSGFSSVERRKNVVSASERLSLGRLHLKVGGVAE